MDKFEVSPRRIMLPAIVLLALLAGGLAISGGAAGQDCKKSQDCALGAREQGKIRTLTEVLVAARAAVPGEVVKIELERENGLWVYEVKILSASGRRRTVEINAETLAVIKVE